MLTGASVSTLNSQCIVTNLGVNLKSYNPTTCQVQFDLSWEQEVNNGNKFAYVHLWTGNQYHTPAANWTNMYSNPAAYPLGADLVNALATISIFDNGSAAPKIGTVYPPDDPAVVPLSAGLSIVKTPLPGGIRERMTILNISLVLASCENVINIKGDVWASQASNGKNVHCASQGLIFNLNNPRVTGFKVCEPRSVSFGIANNDPVETIVVYYQLYKDDGDDLFEPGDGPGLDGLPLIVSSDITIDPLKNWSVTKMPYPGSDVGGETGSLWVEVITKVPAFSFAAIARLADPGCAPLAVKFGKFTAKRNGSQVLLDWETREEMNVSGFTIERKTDGGWIQIATVPTKAVGGNSSMLLTYQYADFNPVRGISQYRIRQNSNDGRYSYSETRAVYGEGAGAAITIYPNPAYNGRFNIVFPDALSGRTIVIADMSGRIVRQLGQIDQNTVLVEQMRPGIYLVKIIHNETREQQVIKVMVY